MPVLRLTAHHEVHCSFQAVKRFRRFYRYLLFSSTKYGAGRLANMNLKDLAKELNLSISTVSKALRDLHDISPATKELVRAKAKELNFQVNPFASGLRKQKTNTIAVIIPEIANNFFTLAINGIESIAQEKGYHVLIYLTHEDMKREVAIIELLQNGRVDGILISLSGNASSTKHLEDLRDKKFPLVFFDRVAEHINVPKVTTDDFNSGIKATEHLIENGCKRISFLSISPTLSISTKRMGGYLEALKNHYIREEPTLVIQCVGDDKKDAALIRQLLKRKDRPDGVFAVVEKLAIFTYEVCEELELRIPDDVKLVSFSNLQTAALLKPSLTTITQPAYDIGREAAAMLFKLVERKKQRFHPEQVVLNSKLFARGSSAKK
jgi:LacI family transcriptional regulator